jgi:hypothetical protein
MKQLRDVYRGAMRTLRLALTSAVTLIVLASCSSASDTKTDTETTSPSETTSASETSSSPTESTTSSTEETTSDDSSGSGESIGGIGYTVTLPTGWEDVTDAMKQANARADIGLAEPASTGFRTNFNVVQPSPVPANVTEQQLAAEAAKELKSVTHQTVTTVEGPDFDGSNSIGQTSGATASGVDVTLIQYIFVHDHKVYATTMTFDASRTDEAQATLDDLVGSWTWTT